MFATFNRRFGRIALGAAILPAALAAAGAGPAPDRDGWNRGRDDRWGHRDWGHSDHDHYGINVGVVIGSPRPVIVHQPPVVISRPVVVRTYADVMPCELGFAAYQSRDTIILVATGANRGSGYTTALTDVDCHGGTPVVTMRNTPSCEVDFGRPATDRFSMTASIRSTECVKCLTVFVAGQRIEVPVVQAQPLT